jgi:hypothetical protein
VVTVVKPEGIKELIDEEGTLKNGKFSFDSTGRNCDRHRNRSRDHRSRSSMAFGKGTRAYPKARCEHFVSQWTNPAWRAQRYVTSYRGADGRKRPCVNKMTRHLLYILIGILAAAFCVLVFLRECVSLPQTTPRPSPTAHSAG